MFASFSSERTDDVDDTEFVLLTPVAPAVAGYSELLQTAEGHGSAHSSTIGITTFAGCGNEETAPSTAGAIRDGEEEQSRSGCDLTSQ